MPEFSDMLKYFRKKSNLTQQELADKTDVSRSRINNYEQGIRKPDFETAEVFADFFNVDLDTLLGRTVIDRPAASYSDSFFSSLSDEEAYILSCYRSAPKEIKDIVKFTLSKYTENPEESSPSA